VAWTCLERNATSAERPAIKPWQPFTTALGALAQPLAKAAAVLAALSRRLSLTFHKILTVHLGWLCHESQQCRDLQPGFPLRVVVTNAAASCQETYFKRKNKEALYTKEGACASVLALLSVTRRYQFALIPAGLYSL
jgi:hypothetical protein